MARIQTRKDLSRKDVITHAAAGLFRERGFKAASMRDLAVKVGVEAASLYNHIQSKTDILQDICSQVAQRFTDHMDEVESSKAPVIDKIKTLLHFHIRQMVRHYEEVCVSDREWRHLGEPYLSDFREQRRTYRKRFAAIIQQGIDRGEISAIDAPTAVLIILHAVNGIESWHRSTQRISEELLERNMITILTEGLKKDLEKVQKK